MGETPVQFLGLEVPPREGIDYPLQYSWAFPGGSDGKASACSAGDLGSIPGLGRSPGGGHGNPLQYSCLENLMDRGAWWATVHRITQRQTWLKQLSMHYGTELYSLLYWLGT